MENNEELIARLDALEQRGPRSGSKTERLRQVLDHIERLLKKGFTQVEVLAELNESGFNMTLASFKSTLQRLRKERTGIKEQPATRLAAALKQNTQDGNK